MRTFYIYFITDVRIRGYFFLSQKGSASKNVGKPCFDGYSGLFLQPLDPYGINETEFLAMSNINLRNVPTFELLTAIFLMIWVFWDVTQCQAIDS
jgi:hypothetical protein